MKLNDYQSLAYTTAIYPYQHRLLYPVVGLNGECDEFYDKLRTPGELHSSTAKELGDILWYLAAIATECGVFLSECAGVESFDDLEGCDEEFLEVAIARAKGPLNESLKKAIRDDDDYLTGERLNTVRDSIGALLNVLYEYALELQTTLDKVAEENYNKLKSRQERGVLKGSGDNR